MEEEIELTFKVIEKEGKYYYEYLALNTEGELEVRLAPL